MLGAYGVAMSTGFNGYGEHELAAVEDAPMASLYGLAPRSIPTVRTTAEEQARKVVRLSRPKGKAGQRKKRGANVMSRQGWTSGPIPALAFPA